MDFSYNDLPARDSEAFRSVINASSPASTAKRRPTPDTSENQGSYAPYVSFGDGGTTASVGAYGSLLRICRPVQDLESVFESGMFGLEYNGNGAEGAEKAWLVSYRAESFMEHAQNISYGFGLRIEREDTREKSTSVSPVTRFINNRWPETTYLMDGYTITVTSWCRDDMVFQRMRLKRGTSIRPLHLVLDLNSSMQDINYLKRKGNLKTKVCRGPHEYGAIILHEVPMSLDDSKKSHIQKNVCVLAGLYKDGAAQQLKWDARWKEKNQFMIDTTTEFRDTDAVEFTAAFKLQVRSQEAQWSDFIIPATLAFDPIPTPYTERSNFLKSDLSWHLHRNLEHILSVCSISIGVAPRTDSSVPEIVITTANGFDEPLQAQSLDPIALTCGDFGDHRVSVSGSYFAFMFMLDMHEKVTDMPQLQKRIHNICKGHLTWVSNLSLDALSSSNLWVSGHRTGESDETALPLDNPTSWASHIIKATQYLRVFQSNEDLKFVCRWLGDNAQQWHDELCKSRNRLTPTWQHKKDSEIPTYRLSDQVWIWKALTEIEYLIQRVDEKLSDSSRRGGSPDSAVWTDFLRIKSSFLNTRTGRLRNDDPALRFTAEEMRKQNLRRFTIENDILNKRMLSVTRSARDTRFLLHSRDTVLYYGLKWGFFKGEEKLLYSLISAQKLHDEDSNDESEWDNPLRYGLAMEMAQRKHQLERQFEPLAMHTRAKEVLVNSSSGNGVFPGRLDAFSKEAVIFDHELFRDFYFHVGFEIPYILLRSGSKPDLLKMSPEESLGLHSLEHEGQGAFSDDLPLSRTINVASFTRPSSPALPALSINPADHKSRGYANYKADTQQFIVQRTLKRLNQYGKLADVSSIVDVTEEWLYRYPDFLAFIPATDESGLESLQITAWKVMRQEKLLVDLQGVLNPRGGQSPPTLSQGLYDLPVEPILPTVCRWYATVTDISKNQKRQKMSGEQKFETTRFGQLVNFEEKLSKPRNPQASKKRLVYISSVNYHAAAICHATSPPRDRLHMENFFNRHATVDTSFFHDDTAVVFNNWVTEFHFRYYRKVDMEEKPKWLHSYNSPSYRNHLPPQERTHVRHLMIQRCKAFGPEAYIVEEMVSFRIIGDFFDRYWTCYILESSSNKHKDDLFNERLSSDHPHWHQRKVLELILFSQILENVCHNMSLMLGLMERDPRSSTSDNQQTLFAQGSFKNRKPQELEECFHVLRIFKHNITSLQDLIEEWNHRESSQGRERPRWTRNDEQKYHRDIRIQLNNCEKKVRGVKALSERIDFLINLVNTAQEAIVSQKSLKQARDVGLFTYVTLFFLPTSLAVAVFSMNGVPQTAVIIDMVVTAVIALFITCAVLWWALGMPAPAPVAAWLGNGRGQVAPEEDEVIEESIFQVGNLEKPISLERNGVLDKSLPIVSEQMTEKPRTVWERIRDLRGIGVRRQHVTGVEGV